MEKELIKEDKKMNDPEKVKNDLKEESNLINEAIVRARGEVEQARKELADLEAQLRDALAHHFLGGGKGEVTRLKRKRTDLREFLEDHEFVLKGLESKLTTLKEQERHLNVLWTKLQRIEVLKTQLQGNQPDTFDKPDPLDIWKSLEDRDREKELLKLSTELGSLDDAKNFLEKLKAQRAQMSVT